MGGSLEEVVEDVLAHYGTKGMKWGVRKSRSKSGPVPVTVTQKKPGTKVKASGGKNQPASEDAKRAAAIRQKAKKSSTDSLSNQELRELVNRRNLEQQYANSGKSFASRLLKNVGQQQASLLANEQATKVRKKVS